MNFLFFDYLNPLFRKLYIHIFAHQNKPFFLSFSLKQNEIFRA
jgi:hypothetical protein